MSYSEIEMPTEGGFGLNDTGWIITLGARASWKSAPAIADAERRLAEARRSILPDAPVPESAARFARIAGPSRVASGTGHIMASAHADVARGWPRYPDRFGAIWRDAVNRISAFIAGEMRGR